ncbi:MAG TPA: L-aspartate oxidase [Thermomicrobiales bacterium]|nr:L-aspartate oxidase [Thermomicrobiales bacterium]
MNMKIAPNGAAGADELGVVSGLERLVASEVVDQLPGRTYDVVVVGAGVAGLAFTLRLPASWRVALLTKGHLGESNTRYAQGGLAAAVGGNDSPALHEVDTIEAGAGLCDVSAVHQLVEGAPEAVAWLLDVGTRFDRDAASGELLLGREAAHSRRRVLHAGGDATGAEIERALVASVQNRVSVELFEDAFAVDLIVEDGRVCGLVAETAEGDLIRLDAPQVVIAAGGAGQLWATTSNPPGATADGLAMALRAGAAVADLEFTQFHPTVLALPDGAPFLISEAVRGEGAYLRDKNGERFMPAQHPLAELAPRDVVARAIQRQMGLDGTDHVDLDLRHLDAEAMRARFPTIAQRLAEQGLDLATDLIPVAPAAHYFMGGIVAGTTGETSLPGLLALGEASCTGVHGANRLASNSLLEGLVFGLAAADRLAREGQSKGVRQEEWGEKADGRQTISDASREAVAEARRQLQRTMSRHVAVVRDAEGLREAAGDLRRVTEVLRAQPASHRAVWEAKNMVLAAGAITRAATVREESRGAHFRADFPATDPDLDGRHLLHDSSTNSWRFGSLSDVLAPVDTATAP